VRQRLKLILFAALSAALTVAGLSMAAGGGSGSDDSKSNGDPRPGRHVERGFVPAPGFGARFDSDVEDVMHQIHDAVEQKAPEIAAPIIQKAEDAGDITAAQADQLRSIVKDEGERKPPSPGLQRLFSDRDVRNVMTDVLKAKQKETPAIAEPIVQKALDDEKITSAQADDIRERVKHPPFFFHGGFRDGHGPGGRHELGPFKLGPFDRDMGNVLRDIHQSVEKKAPEIAAPIIQKAEDAGDITSAQADKLRAAAQAIADGKHPDGDLRALLSDPDVRKVVRDSFDAARKQAPAIAEPIIDKAVQEKKITSSQADDIRNALKREHGLHFAPPRFAPGGPPGPPPPGAPRGFGRPGFAPGAPPDMAPATRPAIAGTRA
jgi:hypothetical protein